MDVEARGQEVRQEAEEQEVEGEDRVGEAGRTDLDEKRSSTCPSTSTSRSGSNLLAAEKVSICFSLC